MKRKDAIKCIKEGQGGDRLIHTHTSGGGWDICSFFVLLLFPLVIFHVKN